MVGGKDLIEHAGKLEKGKCWEASQVSSEQWQE
jgi:hypothetical protein